jgi:hypothetical protein
MTDNDFEALLRVLDLESADQFDDFEQLAALIEDDHPVDEAAVHRLLGNTVGSLLADLIENYFEDLLTGVPDDDVDFYTLLTLIGRSLSGLAARSAADSDDRHRFIDELLRFRDWVTAPGNVQIKNPALPDSQIVSILEALALYRLDQLDPPAEDRCFDYSAALDYEVEEFSLSF